jgi:hypothetical protein
MISGMENFRTSIGSHSLNNWYVLIETEQFYQAGWRKATVYEQDLTGDKALSA